MPTKTSSVTLKRPQKLRPGSTVALIAPAFGFDPNLLEQGRKLIETKYGLKTVILDSVHQTHQYFAGNDERRLEELHYWLTHPEVDGVIAIRGGYGCARIYPELIRRLKKRKTLKPKVVMGYSDLTILLNGLHQDLGWTTFHGPVVVGRPFREPLELEEASFVDSIMRGKPLGIIADPETKTLHSGKAQGKLVGGCLTLLVGSLGTSYEIDTKNKILFIEEVDERPYRIDRMLVQLMHSGKLDKVRGIVFGKMLNCEPPQRDASRTSVLDAIKNTIGDHARRKKIPVIYDFPAGHGSPQVTFAIGSTVVLHASEKRAALEFKDSGVR